MSVDPPPAPGISPGPRRVVVVGAGVTGLAAAHRLLELAAERSLELDLRVVEAGARAGGLVRTDRRDGFLVEAGPESFITDKPWAAALCERLGLDDQLIGANPGFRRSFIAREGRLVPIPDGFQVLAPSRLRPMIASPLLSWRGKARVALEPLVRPRRAAGDESVGAFVERRFGREALLRLAEPLVGGIYGGDPYALSLEATLPRFRKMEQEHGSLLRALRARRGPPGAPHGAPPSGPEATPAGTSGARYSLFVTLREGMQTLTDTLAARLPAGALQLNTPALAVERSGTGGAAWTVHLSGGEQLAADAICLALPAHAAGALLRGTEPELAVLLEGIPYGDSATASLAYRRDDIPRPLNGFGFVVPAAERRGAPWGLLGCTFASVKFPGRAPAGQVLLRVFFAGEQALAEKADLLAGARADLSRYLGIRAAPLWSAVYAWPRSMPRYPVGHLETVRAIEERAARCPGLALAGNAYRGVGIPDSVRSAETAAESIAAFLVT